MENSKLFYEARDAVQNESYLKSKTKTLRKYLAELSIVQPWESDRNCWGAVERKQEWLQKIKTELQRRKDSHLACARSWTKSILKYVVAPVVVGVILYFVYLLLSSNLQDKHNTMQPQPHQQLKDSHEPSPTATPSTNKTDQQHKKSK